MGNLRIGIRLFILIAVVLLALLVIGLTSYMGLIQSTDALTKLNKANVDQSILERLGRMIEVDIPNLANSANLGAISFDQATRDLEKIRVQDEKVWEDLIQAVPDSDKASLLEKKEITDQASGKERNYRSSDQ